MRTPGLFVLRWAVLSLTAELAVLGRRLSETSLNFVHKHPDRLGLIVARTLHSPIQVLRAVGRRAQSLNERLRRRWEA